MGTFGSLQGHYSLQTASKVKSDLIFKISGPNYLLNHVHIFNMVWALLVAFEAASASGVKTGLRFQICDPNYLLILVHIAYMVWVLLAASEATTASQQPWGSNLTSDSKSNLSHTALPQSTCSRLHLCRAR